MAKHELLKNILVVIAGGAAETAIEGLTDKYAPAADMGGINTGDAVGTGLSLAATAAGAVSKKPALTLFGAGGVAVGAAGILAKLYKQNLDQYIPFSAKLGNGYAGPVAPMSSGIAPPASPQERLLVGSPGGGHVVYKPNAAGSGGVNPNRESLFV